MNYNKQSVNLITGTIEEKREEYEKATLYKTFKETEISLEEYQLIIKNADGNYMRINNIVVGKINEYNTEYNSIAIGFNH